MLAAAAATSLDFYVFVMLLGIVMLLFSHNKKAIIIAVVMAAAAIPALKTAYGEGRPCSYLPFCPEDNGLPSGHTTLAFIFMAGSMGSVAFYFFFPAGLLVSASRLTLGVHSAAQVAAGAGLGCALFFASMGFLRAFGYRRGEKIHWRIKRFARRQRA